MSGITVLLAVITTAISVQAASIGKEPKTCDVIPFQRRLFNESFVLENRFDCIKSDNKLEAGDFCFHVYKCPLDSEEKDRHSSCICKSDGTWDFHYPTCEDLIPYADSLLHSLEKRSNAPTEIRADDNAKHGTNFQVSVKSSSIFVKPPMPKPTPKPEPTTKPAPKLGKAMKEKLKSVCNLALICTHLNQWGGQCKRIEELKESGEFFLKLCNICYKTDSCKQQVEMFG